MMRTLKWAAIWLTVLAIGAAVLWQVAIRWHPPDEEYPTQGVTISSAQGEVHWPTLSASGTDFAYLAATQGSTGRDPRFAANWASANEAGVRRGAIHVWQLCDAAIDQATNFIATVPAEAEALPPAVMFALDGQCATRPDAGRVLDELAMFLEMIETHSEKSAVLYVTRDFDEAYRLTGRVERSLWLQRRLFPPDYGAMPWVMWEASDMRRVPGVEHRAAWTVVRPGEEG